MIWGQKSFRLLKYSWVLHRYPPCSWLEKGDWITNEDTIAHDDECWMGEQIWHAVPRPELIKYRETEMLMWCVNDVIRWSIQPGVNKPVIDVCKFARPPRSTCGCILYRLAQSDDVIRHFRNVDDWWMRSPAARIHFLPVPVVVGMGIAGRLGASIVNYPVRKFVPRSPKVWTNRWQVVADCETSRWELLCSSHWIDLEYSTQPLKYNVREVMRKYEFTGCGVNRTDFFKCHSYEWGKFDLTTQDGQKKIICNVNKSTKT